MGNLLCLSVGLCCMFIVLPLYAYLCINTCGLGAGLLIILLMRLSYSESILAFYKRTVHFSWVPFRQYLAYSRLTFQMIFTADLTFGPLFLAFLAVNMPISAILLIELAFGGHSLQSTIVLTLMASHELLCCIVLHWAVAKFTKRLHAPSKRLLSLNAATTHRVGDFRARLQLHHSIVRLHTDVKYGITYGYVGCRITMGSFGKCMLFYTELLMYAYKFCNV